MEAIHTRDGKRHGEKILCGLSRLWSGGAIYRLCLEEKMRIRRRRLADVADGVHALDNGARDRG